jgi:hypothetical protein
MTARRRRRAPRRSTARWRCLLWIRRWRSRMLTATRRRRRRWWTTVGLNGSPGRWRHSMTSRFRWRLLRGSTVISCWWWCAVISCWWWCTVISRWRCTVISCWWCSRWRRPGRIIRLRHARRCGSWWTLHALSRRRWCVARPRALRRRCVAWRSLPSGWLIHTHSMLGGWLVHAHSRLGLARSTGRTGTSRSTAWCSRWSGRSRGSSPWSRRRGGIVHKLHKLRVAVRSTLERGSVLDHEPKESRLRVRIAFSNHIDLGTDKDGCTFAVSEGPNNRTKP